MKIVIAPDKFKSSLSSLEFCEIVGSAIHSIDDNVNIVFKPMADGGDGTADVLYAYSRQKYFVESVDAFGRSCCGEYVVLDNKTVIVEMSQTVGLAKLQESEYDIMKASSYGFGLVVRSAIEAGYTDFVLGIGGSASNDCALGMMSALGVKFFDKNYLLLDAISSNLENIYYIDTKDFDTLVSKCCFKVACDVRNTLYGANGAAYVYAPQKGANLAQVEYLDKSMRLFAERVKDIYGVNMATIVGGGAAGGVGASLSVFFGAELCSGAKLIAQTIKLEEDLLDADLLITGEGKIDAQTQNGKLLNVLFEYAQKYNINMIAYCGVLDNDFDNSFDVYSIVGKGVTREQSMSNTKELLYELVKKTIKKYLKNE